MKKINDIIKITLLKNYRIEENEIFFSNKINNKKITKKHCSSDAENTVVGPSNLFTKYLCSEEWVHGKEGLNFV